MLQRATTRLTTKGEDETKICDNGSVRVTHGACACNACSPSRYEENSEKSLPSAVRESQVAPPKSAASRCNLLVPGSFETDAYSPREFAFAELNSVPASPRSGLPIEFLPEASTLDNVYCCYVAEPSFSVGASDYVLKGMRPTSRTGKDGSQDISRILPPEATYTLAVDGLAEKFVDVRVHY